METWVTGAILQAAMQAPVGIAVFDEELRFLFVNDKLAAMNGLPADEHLGHIASEFLPDLGPLVYDTMRALLSTGTSRTGFELHAVTPSDPGRLRTWTEDFHVITVEGRPALLAFVTEITAEREARSAAAEATGLLGRVVGVMPSAVLITDPSGATMYANASADVILGVGPTRRADVDGFVREALETRASVRGEVVRSQGEPDERQLLVGVEPLLDENGQALGVVVNAIDVTEQVQIGRIRSSFLGMLSHEIRTPITSIYGASIVLSRPGLDDALRSDLTADIREASEQLSRTVDNLMVLARSERGLLETTLEPVLLHHLVSRVMERLLPLWPSIRIRVEARRTDPVAGNEAGVEQILTNLLTNAARYGDGEVSVRLVSVGECVELQVDDDGPGLPPLLERRVFEPWFRGPTASDRADGSGIGLFVVRELARAMSGELRVERLSPRGTRMVLSLPRMHE